MKTPSLTFPNFITQQDCIQDNVLSLIENQVINYVNEIENHYNVKIKQIVHPFISSHYSCTFDNEIYSAAKYVKLSTCGTEYSPSHWKKINDYDFTGYIALTQYNDYYPFNPTSEVWGGELFFHYYGAKIIPTAGNLIVFPTCSNFCYSHLDSNIGNLIYVKLFFICEDPFVYDFRLYGTTPFTRIVNME